MTNDVEARFQRIEAILDRVAGTAARQDATLDRIEATAARHNEEIQALIQLTAENSEAIRQTTESIRDLDRRWQAYLTTIHPKQ